jgi:uncharacterized protein DUF6551
MSTSQAARTVTHQIVERKLGDKLFVDPNVQRTLRVARVNKMVGAFNADALGVLTTSLRPDGQLHVVDGQHRWRTIEAVGYTGTFITNEYHGLTLAEEAALFRLLNAAEKPSALDRFVVSCVEQNPDSVKLASFMKNHGWTVGAYVGTGKISAITSLERVYKLGPVHADATLAVLTAAYGHQAAAVQGALIEGVGRFLHHYDGQVHLNDLTQRLSGYPGGPNGVVGNARGRLAARTGTLSKEVALLALDIYNQRRRSSALPAWDAVETRAQ